MDFAKALEELKAFFEREGFPFAVIGAFGLYAYGLTRATSDLDIVTDHGVQNRLMAFLESMGYETLHVSAGYSNHLHGDPEMGRLDFVFVSGETSRRLFKTTRLMPVLAGVSIAVPRPEHLAAMKIQAMKNDPGRTFQEMADILFLMRLPETDRQEIRDYFEKQGMLDKYDEITKVL